MVKVFLAVLCSMIAALAMGFFAGYHRSLAPWMLDPGELFAGFIFAAFLGIAILLIKTPFFRQDNFFYSLVRTIFIGAIVSLPALVLLLFLARGGLLWMPILGMPTYSLPNTDLIFYLGLYFSLLVLNSLPLRDIILLALNICVLMYSVMPSLTETSRSSLRDIVAGKTKLFDWNKKYLFSSLHDLEVTEYLIFPMPKVIRGGGLSVIDDKRLILVTAGGKVRLLYIENDGLSLLPAIHKTPFDVNTYLKEVEDPSQYFRVTGSLLEATSDGLYKIYISYHHWDVEKSCLTMKVSEATLDIDKFGETTLDWVDRFTSTPCIEKKIYNATGGRMALLGDHTLLLTVGETVSRWDLHVRAKASYGKIIALDKQNWESRIFSRGHRNPQGLMVLDDGTIWSTEHGPQGGDELNLIHEGVDYGWPKASYGTDYGKKNFWYGDTPGDHTFGQRPVYAWVPSIGISNLISIRGTAYPSWRGDFMVSSLYGRWYGRSLFRVKVAEDRVVAVERIRTGRPIRDLVELVDGRLALWDGYNRIQIVKPTTAAFSVCSGCHALEKETHGIGPDLMGVVGQDVARHTSTGYQYSKAMKKLGGTWTREKLDKFLENPAAVVPGTTMNFPGIADPVERREIIDYLRKLQLPRDS
jgi:cytochrome c2